METKIHFNTELFLELDSTLNQVYFYNKKSNKVITEVQITKNALKDLKRAPLYLQEKFRAWLVAVNKAGLEETRKHPGWHDEPLLGEPKGQHSIRLNRQWRAIYISLIVMEQLNL